MSYQYSKMRGIHECSLSTRSLDVGLYPLRPNASPFKRLFRFIRKFYIMDLNNYKSKEFFRNKSTMLVEQKRHARSPQWSVIHPFSKFSNVLDLVFFFSWFFQYFNAAIVRGLNTNFNILLHEIVKISQYFVFVSFFFLGYVKNKEKEIIIDRKKIVCHYLRTYFVFDLVGIFLRVVLIILFHDNYHLLGELYVFNVGNSVISTIAHLARFKYFLMVLRRITKMFFLPKPIYYFFSHFVVISIVMHIFTCALFSIPPLVYGGNFPADSWMVQAEVNDLKETPFLRLYTESFMIVFCYFFGAAHQKYEVYQPCEEIILTVIVIFGRLYTLFVIADLLKMFGVVGVSESKYEQYMGQVDEYMSSKHLPEELRMRMYKYYEFKFQKRYFDEHQILSTLSEQLKIELFLFGARKLIEKSQILNNLPKSVLGRLFTHMKSETFLPMDVITRIGGSVENVYFISTGTVAVINKDDHELCHLQDGEEFGFLSLWTSADVTQLYMHVAVETSEIYYLPKKLLIGFLESHPDVLRYFENKVKGRLKKYHFLESTLLKGGDDIISSLRRGKILERQPIRPVNLD